MSSKRLNFFMLAPIIIESMRLVRPVILQTAKIYSHAAVKALGWRSAVGPYCKFNWCAVYFHDFGNFTGKGNNAVVYEAYAGFVVIAIATLTETRQTLFGQ